MIHALDGLIAAHAGLSGDRVEVDARHQADGADVGHVGHALEAHHGVGEHRLQLLSTLEQALVLVDVEGREACRSRQRMARVRVAVEQLDHVLGASHEGLVDALGRHDARHRHRRVGDALGEGDHVGLDVIPLGGEAGAEASEARDDLVEDQQDAVL